VYAEKVKKENTYENVKVSSSSVGEEGEDGREGEGNELRRKEERWEADSFLVVFSPRPWGRFQTVLGIPT